MSPLYDYRCEHCGEVQEVFRHIGVDNPPECCGTTMNKTPTAIAMIRIKGQGLPARKKWFDNWHPGVPNLSIGSHHGERY